MAESPPPPSATPFSSSSAFSHLISEKLTDLNFLLWKQQVEPVIKAHQLHRYLVCTIPLRYANEADQNFGTVNPVYTAWEIQDQMLLTWLQSILSSSILSCILGSVHSFQVWEKIHDHFQKLTQARAH